MTETEFKLYLIDQYKKLNGAEDTTNFTIQELKTAISFQEKLNALKEAEEAKKEKEPKIPKITGINGAKENSALLKQDILETIQLLTPPQYDPRVETDQAFKKDNQVKATGEEDEIIIFRDENGRLMG